MIYIKTDKEIELMREPCKILRDALLLAEDKIRAGMTTGELDEIVRSYITSYGAKPSFLGLYGFPKSTCISIDEQVVHGIPGDRIIKEGEIVSVDVGVYLNGFHGDAARSFYVGQIDPMKKKLIDKLLKVENNAFAVSQIENVETSDISNLHSFCSRLVSTYFYEVGIDPAFHVIDDTEATHLKDKALSKLFEQKEREGDLDWF